MKKWLLRIFLGLFIFLTVIVVAGGIYFFQILSDLPDISSVDAYRPSLTTVFYTVDDEPFAEYAVEKRILVSISYIPKDLINAIVAVEDARFFQHKGLDWTGISRAFWKNVQTMSFAQGASTITQQLSRNLFLTREKSIRRKVREAIIATKIEEIYTKKDILELYLNQVYLGSGAYGVEAAAKIYFNKSVKDLNLEECALVAGLPKAPSRYSPKRNPDLAKKRRAVVLKRMMDEHFIDRETFDKIKDRDIKLAEGKIYKTQAPYFSEHVRRILEKKFGAKRLYRDGFHVYTTLDLKQQKTARDTLRWGLEKFDKRHGYRTILNPSAYKMYRPGEMFPQKGDVVLGEVVQIQGRDAIVQVGEDFNGLLPAEGYAWTKADIPEAIFQAGDSVLVRVSRVEEESGNIWFSLEQEPVVQGSLVSIEVETGYVKAMVGGYDFEKSKFIRAIQALRQPGSAFKPIIYTTALSQGYTLADILMDSPLIYRDRTSVGDWRPENYYKKFFGPTTLRTAIAHSRNVVTIKLLKKIGIGNVIKKARAMGLNAKFARDLSLALGTSGISLLDMTATYGVFAGGGIKVKPVMIRRIVDSHGNVIEENKAVKERAISEQEAYLMNRLLMGVVENGTGWRARALGRDVAGKTGTTDKYVDAWFLAYTPKVVTGVWVGYDEYRTLGKMETGSKAASPIWVKFMQKILKGTPLSTFPRPDGIIRVAIDVETGLLAAGDCEDILMEDFIKGKQPKMFCNKHRSAPDKFQIVDMEIKYFQKPQQEKPTALTRDLTSLD